MSSRYAPLSLPQLLDALTVCLWRAYGRGEVFPRVGTHDARRYTCVVTDSDDGAVRTDAPTVVSTTERDAVEGMLALYEDADVDAALAEGTPYVPTLRDLADGTAPYTVQCDPAELGADGRATDDVAEVA